MNAWHGAWRRIEECDRTGEREVRVRCSEERGGAAAIVGAELTDERLGIMRGKAEAQVDGQRVADAVLWGTADKA